MNRRCPWLVLFLTVVCVPPAMGEEGDMDPLRSLLIPPEVLFRHRQDIGLSEEQVSQIRSRVQAARPAMQGVRQRAHTEMGRLAELLSAEKVNQEEALNQLDRVLSVENEQKRLHLKIMIQIRNSLTSEQIEKAKTHLRRPAHPGVQQRLKAKLTRIEADIRSRAQAGQPPFEAVGLMQKFPELMQSGQVEVAEALLDRVIALLDSQEPEQVLQAGPPKRMQLPPRQLPPLEPPPLEPPPLEPPPQAPRTSELVQKIRRIQQHAQALREKGEDVSDLQALMEKIGPLLQQGKTDEAEKLLEQFWKQKAPNSQTPHQPQPNRQENPDREEALLLPSTDQFRRYSPQALQTQISGLKAEDVAWRKIDWKTCLLDGLRASRDQKKPILLWIFIDRPIDDERC